MLCLFSFACMCVFRADYLFLNNRFGTHPQGRPGLPLSALTHLPRALFLGVAPHETHLKKKDLFFSTFLDLGCSHMENVLLISLVKTTFEACVVPVATIYLKG